MLRSPCMKTPGVGGHSRGITLRIHAPPAALPVHTSTGTPARLHLCTASCVLSVSWLLLLSSVPSAAPQDAQLSMVSWCTQKCSRRTYVDADQLDLRGRGAGSAGPGGALTVQGMPWSAVWGPAAPRVVACSSSVACLSVNKGGDLLTQVGCC